MDNWTLRLLMAFILVISQTVSAEIIELETAERRIAQAEFLQGDNDANPILILHGFLQTREFPTVNRLAVALNESGYTVLAPSLSLGISRRKKSLACEAIHTHNTESDTAEIAQWIDWLQQKTGKPLTLIGHSQGTQVLLSYMNEHDGNHIDKAIFISMTYFAKGPAANETAEIAERARNAIAAGNDPLDNYALSFCKTYPTRASDFLSYFDWGRDKVAGTASKFAQKVSIIIGTGDQRIEKNWRQQLEDSHIHVIAIEGANHFFDQAHEFDLLENIENLLTQG